MLRSIIIILVSALLSVYLAVSIGIINTSPFIYIHDNQIDMDYHRVTFMPEVQNHKIWMMTYKGELEDIKKYLFDLKQNKIIGQTEESFGGMYNDDHFLVGIIFTRASVWRHRTTPGMHEIELISLADGAIKHLGEIPFKTGTSGIYSPNKRYFLFSESQDEQIIVDFKLQELIRFRPIKKLYSWWSDHECVYIDLDSNIVKIDLESKREEILLSPQTLSNYLHGHDINMSHQTDFKPISHWNGNDYDLLFISKHRRKIPDDDSQIPIKEKWLVKLNKQNKKLELLSRNFPYNYRRNYYWDLSKYVYSTNNSIVLVDSQSQKETVLLDEPFPPTEGRRTIFYEDKIIYETPKYIMMMDMDGNNKTRLFPPIVESVQ